MAGYLGTKAVLLSTTAADVVGNAEIGGDLTVGGAFTSQGIDDNASATAMTLDASGNVGIGETSPDTSLDVVGGSADSVVDTLTLKNDSTGASAGVGLNFVVDGVNDVTTSAIYGQRTGSAYHQGSLQFLTNDNAGGGLLERMRIDASGTTTLQQTKAYGSETAVLRVRTIPTGTNYSSGAFQNIVFGDETIVNSYFGQLAVVQENAAASTASTMRFYTNGGGGNAATQERMRIDSSGRVTMPYQPAFYGAYTGVNVAWGNSQTFGWNIVHMNVGNHFNGGTGLFTAPVSGVYSFNYNTWASSGPTQVCLKINGTDWKPTGADTQGIANLASTDGQRTGGATLVIPLSAGDYVHVGMRAGFADTIYMGHSHFSGYLIG